MIKKVFSLIPLLFFCTSILFSQDEKSIGIFFDDITAGNIKGVKNALKNGIDVDVKDSSGFPALFVAGTSYQTDIVKLLIKEGADVNAKDDGWQKENAFGTLIPFYGMDLEGISDKKDREKAIKDSYDIVKLLIQSGLDVNVPEDSGFSPLMNTAEYNLPEICELLIKNGADVNYVGYGFTALLYAAKRSLAIVEILLKNGADITFTDEEYGDNVLMHAISSSKEATDIVKFLIKQGVDPNLTNNDGYTALDIYYHTSVNTNGKKVSLSILNMELGAYLEAAMKK